ncbi:SbcC ATPase [Pyrenophora tritici-repentis]|uniref:DNA repair protein RAD50 n=2 Tax=Pyrenophora tritici-repentis TaxID=45151 RepID=A0A2W1HY13_9PLEO|nr:DNA repair protein rad50 [Pyrenophora tritici-repentis Pt-1C-BFP]KAA8612740.1 DNA repair protein rad50 [Pyrenophora tritici-repentis]EDU47419.1 DNA repair protein rad50 [Pyrenophora tritici-repentis Pt-1C-BFP]KAF7446737.1 DNA repair protein rad50 [Pyrenophora tritici-repentis]KAF7569010.1 SbcC, ATPase involved in DNA repair [Pyrenophora tritici-repentis]KAG9383186.1 DNA repair protein rad50 [Pyrenophora tritici-repentis]
MSKIDRMMIQGVRSFGPEKGETIQFTAPLTLIVGWNGSGKTTIIESLKYATTGDLPTQSKTGGAFIHDPKLRNEKELLAQVKLSFRSTSGVRMVVTRNLQVTVKKNTKSQKTLEGSLLMVKDGEKHSISTRVAELDQIIPQYLGVSKAILDNVIFCHQEDSLWPLSDASTLKKKFDEIFEAMKYTKAIENIKGIRKDRNIELGQLNIIEANAKEDKTRAKKSEDRQAKLFDEIEKLRDMYTDLDAKCTEAQQKASDSYNHAARFEQIVAQLEAKRMTLNINKQNVAELQDSMKELGESDEELQSMLDQYEERVATYATQVAELKEEYHEFKQHLEQNRGALGAKQSEIGKYEAQKEQHERQMQQRENTIKEAAKRHAIRGFDYDITEKQVPEFQQILSKMSRDQNRALERAREETQRDLRDAQGVLNKLNTRKSGLSQSKEAARSQIMTNDKRISELQRTMNQIKADEGSEAILQERKQDVEKQLQDATAASASERYEERISEAARNLQTLEDRKERLTAEFGDASKQARESASIDVKREELGRQQHSLATMKKVHGKRLSQLVDSEWDPATLEATFQQVLSEKAGKVKEAASRRDIAQTKLDKVNFQLSSSESQAKQKRKELQKYETKVKEAIQKDDVSDFDETLQQLEEEYEASSSDKAKFDAQIDYMTKCLESAEKHNICRLCTRSLHDDEDEDFTTAGFIKKLKDIIAKAKNTMQADNADEIFAELEAARNAKPSYELATRLRQNELPDIQKTITNLASERDTLNKQLEEQDAVIHDLEAEKQEVEALSKEVQSIVGYYTRVQELEVEIKELAQKQKSAGLSRGIDAIQSDLQQVSDDGRSARNTLDQLVAARDKARNLITSLELSVRDINAELHNAQSKLKEKRALAERIEEFKRENNNQREAMRSLDQDMDNINPEIEQAQYKYDDINRRGNDRVHRTHDEASKLSESLRQLEKANEEINAYISRGGPQQLERTHRDIENLQGEIVRIETDMVNLTRKIKKLEDTMRDTDMSRRTITENLRYRKAKRSLETLQIEIEKLEGEGAERDKEHYEREAEHWDLKYRQLNIDKTGVERDMKNKDDQLTELMEEYSNLYKDSAQQYREAHIRVETTKAAIEDLGRYAGALDKAIMKYHTLKMEEINRILAELWRNAYQGTDVDTIRIASDGDGKGNRVYNYRVVMIKQDTEMDMRGRCSAGQKVLASIVIRLALAECFGTNCGLIALDEPTTNLDQQNIKGLAESLSQIIQTRRKQANFQLLVITHDEQFLREMNCADYTDSYWRVGRDVKQESYIERQNIAEVT